MSRLQWFATIVGGVACLGGLGIGRAAEPAVDVAAHFDAQIAPFLAAHCLECHNGSEKKGGLDLSQQAMALAGGDSGPVLVAGDADGSLLWQRIRDDEMPPKHPLAAADKELLREWIAGGAAWGTTPIDRLRYTTIARAGYDWWSLQPVRRSEPPLVPDAAGPRNPIDRFVIAKLAEAGLALEPPADRRTLIRRLSFDLIGLPPTPDEVAAFVADSEPGAYDRLVERLLASNHYGERWARHWLDLARFGESNGFEYDEPRRNAWPYRDWVIDALNRDLPFDEFARQQLAGDVLRPGDPEAIKATGFLTAGAFDTAGQNQQSAAMKAVVRQDELEDLVGTISQTFLGLTVNCARCHDHKFDPIRQSEYYRLTSALGGVRHGQRDVTTDAQRAEIAQQAAATKLRIEQIKQRIQALDEPVRARILAERQKSDVLPTAAPAPLAVWDFSSDLQDKRGSLHGTAQGTAAIRDGGLQLDGRDAYVATAPLEKDLREKTLGVWLSLSGLKQSGGGAMSVQALDGSLFDAIVFAEREPGCWVAGSNNYTRTLDFAAPEETEADKQLVHVAIVYAADGTISGYRNGQPYGTAYRSGNPVTFQAGQAQVVFGMRHGPAGGNRMLAGVIARAELYDRALSSAEVAASSSADGFVPEGAILAAMSTEMLAERRTIVDELQKLTTAAAEPPKRLCYAVTPKQPETARLLARGDIRQPGEVVAPGGVASLVGLDADFGLPPDAPESERRAALAQWITSLRNPLFARVIANRLWHYHFGQGLVDTPNDFGFSGARPSHPELLDWLADTLVAEGFSLKQMHRLIVSSAVYCQDAKPNASAARLDADNRLLWRKTPRRLEAEAVRDTMLAVAGELNLAAGGPGFNDCAEVLRSGSYSYLPGDPIGPEFNRRSVYRTWTRGGRSGLLDAFDCPDPSTTAPRRALTTTPQQALVLLNNSFVLRMSQAFARRVEREAGPEADPQIARAYQLAFARDPSAEERDDARPIVAQHGLEVLTRAIFNSNEFLYVD